MNRQTQFFLSIILLITSVACAAKQGALQSDTVKKIDSVLVTPIGDIDFDGKQDSIVCSISGKSWQAPFTVTYSFRNGGNILYSQSFNDAVFDAEFNNSGSLDFCDNGDYLSCKKKWYFDLLLKKIVMQVPLDSDKRPILFDTAFEMGIPLTLQRFYIDSLHYPQNKAVLTAKKSVGTMKKKPLTFFNIPPHPIYSSFPYLFDPVSRKLVLIMGF